MVGGICRSERCFGELLILGLQAQKMANEPFELWVMDKLSQPLPNALGATAEIVIELL